MKKGKKIFLGLLVLVIFAGIYGATKEKGSKETVKTTTKSEPEEKKEKTPYEITDVKVEKDKFQTYVTGVLKNNTDKKKSYVQIVFSVNDKDGNKVASALANVNNLESGKTWKFKAVYIGKEKDVKIDIENPDVSGF